MAEDLEAKVKKLEQKLKKLEEKRKSDEKPSGTGNQNDPGRRHRGN